jgi:glycosyltransferase involved in cell wall biosynthesis
MVRRLRFLVPPGLDDPARVSGGNVYDRALADGLAARDWRVDLVPIETAGDVSRALMDATENEAVLVDGLVATLAAEKLATSRAHVHVLAHMVTEAFPRPDQQRVAAERVALGSAASVIATSAWTADQLVRRRIVNASRVVVALPGVTDGPIAIGEPANLLCVGVLAALKGQDMLLEALGSLRELEWTCTLAGSRSVDPDFARRVEAAASSFGSRVRMPGVLRGDELDRAHASAGVLLAPSRAEGFGMAILDARARGLPVIATNVGGIPEAVRGGGALLVPSDDPVALADALRRWLEDGALRDRLRAELVGARDGMPQWSDTVSAVERALGAA